MFVQRRGSDMVALRVGLAEIVRNDVKVIPLSGAYIPRAEDHGRREGRRTSPATAGRRTSTPASSDTFQGSSSSAGTSPPRPTTSRRGSPWATSCWRRSRPSTGRRDPQLSIRGPGLGKIPQGEIVKITPMKVPRLIGQEGVHDQHDRRAHRLRDQGGAERPRSPRRPGRRASEGGAGHPAHRAGGAHWPT